MHRCHRWRPAAPCAAGRLAARAPSLPLGVPLLRPRAARACIMTHDRPSPRHEQASCQSVMTVLGPGASSAEAQAEGAAGRAGACPRAEPRSPQADPPPPPPAPAAAVPPAAPPSSVWRALREACAAGGGAWGRSNGTGDDRRPVRAPARDPHPTQRPAAPGMAKGKRVSDQQALQQLRDKLQRGEALTEDDRPLLRQIARPDLVALVEAHQVRRRPGGAAPSSRQRQHQRISGPPSPQLRPGRAGCSRWLRPGRRRLPDRSQQPTSGPLPAPPGPPGGLRGASQTGSHSSAGWLRRRLDRLELLLMCIPRQPGGVCQQPGTSCLVWVGGSSDGRPHALAARSLSPGAHCARPAALCRDNHCGPASRTAWSPLSGTCWVPSPAMCRQVRAAASGGGCLH